MAPCPASEALRAAFRRSVRGRWSLVCVSGSSETHRFKAGHGSLRRVGLISTYCHRHVWNRNADLADTLRGWPLSVLLVFRDGDREITPHYIRWRYIGG